MIDVSIIIVNYNSAEYTRCIVDSIKQKTHGIEYEIVVIDNASSEQDIDYLKKHVDAKTIQNKNNLGFGRANNIGIKNSAGRNILFLNPDTKLVNNAIKILSDFLDNNTNVGACGGNLYHEDMSEQLSFWRLLPGAKLELNALFSDIFIHLKYGKSYQFNNTEKPINVGHIVGADLMIPRKIIDRIGYFDKDFFLFYEETELCYRLHKLGLGVVSVPQAKIIHYESQSIGTKLQRLNYMMPSRKLYLEKCVSKKEKFLADTILRINCCLRLVAFTLLFKKDKKIYWRKVLKNIE